MATQKEISTEEMLTEKLRLMELKQRELIEDAKREAITDMRGRERSVDFDGSGSPGKPVPTNTAIRDRLSSPGFLPIPSRDNHMEQQRAFVSTARVRNRNTIPPRAVLYSSSTSPVNIGVHVGTRTYAWNQKWVFNLVRAKLVFFNSITT